MIYQTMVVCTSVWVGVLESPEESVTENAGGSGNAHVQKYPEEIELYKSTLGAF